MIRVLIIDDSSFYRQFLRKCLEAMPEVEVAGYAVDGQDALEQIESLKPDVVTLDLNMPRMNGLQTLAALSAKKSRVQAIVVAAEVPSDVEETLRVLDKGAFDFVVKPNASEKDPFQTLRAQLYTRIIAASKVVKKTVPFQSKPVQPVRPAHPVVTGRKSTPDLVAIGASTGGPVALRKVLGELPANYPCPILVVQHMPKLFLVSLAARLDRETNLRYYIAEDGMLLQPGCVYVAPGGLHMDIVKQEGVLTIKLHASAEEHFCRPAVDVTLRSLSALAPAVNTLVVILTGMGRDGAMEAMNLAEKGAWVIAQDEASSVVWGMPGETVRLGAAHEVLPVEDISKSILNAVALHARVPREAKV